MSSLNKAILIGRSGSNAKVKMFDQGGFVTNLSIATSKVWKDKKTGEKKERTEWHNVVIRSAPLADFAGKYIKKGDLIYIEGELATRKYQDKNGEERYTTEIQINPYTGNLVLLSSKNTKSDDEQQISSQVEIDDDVPF